MRPAIIVLYALALGLSTANAQNTGQETTQALYETCRNEHNPEFEFCLGYISGIGGMMWVLGHKANQIKDLVPLSICGESPSYGAMVQTFVNWAQAHPESWSKNQMEGVTLALREKWPCPVS